MLYTNKPQITSGTRLQSNYDLNKANTSGWYTASTPKNGVPDLNAEKLFVIAPKNKDYITQFAFGDNDNLESMWFRSCANGTWSEWKKVATTDLYLALSGGTITGDLTVKGNINGKFAGTCTGNSATATSAAKLGRDGSPENPMTFNWDGQSGQPNWLWGSNDGTNIYIWNPANFSVAHASNADNAKTVNGQNVDAMTAAMSSKIATLQNQINTITDRMYTPPADVSFFSLNQDGSNIVATVQQASDYDIDHYEIRIGTDWNTAYKIGDFTGNSYSFSPTQNGVCTYLVKAFNTFGNESKNAKKLVINISNAVATNAIYSHRFDTSNYESYQNLYNRNGVMQMIDTRKISDFEYFKDIFGQLTYQDGVIYLPVIDLGENIIDKSAYWTDSKGILHQQEIKKIKDYNTFADIFNGGGDLVTAVSLASTFLTIIVNGTNSDDILKNIKYRTSIDGYTYTDWTPAFQTIFKGRYVQVQITVSSISTHTQCYIDSVDVRINVPDVDISLENIDLIAGDNYVSYKHNFMETPSSIIAFTVDSTGRSASYQITQKDSKGFNIRLYDDKNNVIAGKIARAFIRGY